MAKQSLNLIGLQDLADAITNSPNIRTDEARKCILWLLAHAVLDGGDVALVFEPEEEVFGDDVILSVHGMRSSGGTTHICDVIDHSGLPLDINSGHSAGLGGRAVWIFRGAAMPINYNDRVGAARHIDVDHKAIQAVELPAMAI